MSLRINSNVDAVQAHRHLSATSDAISKSMERLSSGLRINKAADDAAGLGISEKMRSQIRGLAQDLPDEEIWRLRAQEYTRDLQDRLR